MSEYNQILIKKRENQKTASTLEGVVNRLRARDGRLGIRSQDKESVLPEIRELETLIDKLRI